MILIACVDNRFGMLFNGRRLSRDQAVTERILLETTGKKLWMNRYSAQLFPEDATFRREDSFLQLAGDGDYCFVECEDPTPYLDRVEKIVLFHWNRDYPADLYFPRCALREQWHLTETVDFPGNSHSKITMEVYCQ